MLAVASYSCLLLAVASSASGWGGSGEFPQRCSLRVCPMPAAYRQVLIHSDLVLKTILRLDLVCRGSNSSRTTAQAILHIHGMASCCWATWVTLLFCCNHSTCWNSSKGNAADAVHRGRQTTWAGRMPRGTCSGSELWCPLPDGSFMGSSAAIFFLGCCGLS